MKLSDPEVGDTVSFIPAQWADQGPEKYTAHAVDYTVTGRIVRVYEEHRLVRVAYETRYGVQYECFKY